MALQVTSYTRDELIAAVRGDIGLRAPNFIADTDIIRWAGEIVRQAARAAPYYQISASVNVTADTAEYPMPLDLVSLHSVAHNSLPLDEISFDDLVTLDPFWRSRGSGTPYSWYVRGSTAYGLFPTPATTVVNGVQLIYSAIPALPASGSAKYNFPIANEQLIQSYCCYRASMKDATGEGGKRMQVYQQEYLEQMQRLKASVQDMGRGELLVMGGESLLRQPNWRDVLANQTVPAPV